MKMGDLMKQAQQFQERMGTIQEELAGKIVTGSAGGGDVINPDEAQMLQDLVVAAVNDGLRKAQELGKEEMGKLTGGFNIPGMF